VPQGGFFHKLKQGRTTDYVYMYVDTDGAVHLQAKNANVLEVDIANTSRVVVSGDTQQHVAFVENGDDWYIFVNGELQCYASNAHRIDEGEFFDTNDYCWMLL